MITYRCQCGQTLEVGDELAGCKARCPKCRVALVVPMLEEMPVAPTSPASDGAPTVSVQQDITVNPAKKKP